MNKPKVGDILYQLPTRNKDAKLVQVQVVKVGRKYFSVCRVGEKPERWRMDEYEIETWAERTNLSASTTIYASEQEYHDSQEVWRLEQAMRVAFCGWGRLKFTLDQLNRIESITKEGL